MGLVLLWVVLVLGFVFFGFVFFSPKSKGSGYARIFFNCRFIKIA